MTETNGDGWTDAERASHLSSFNSSSATAADNLSKHESDRITPPLDTPALLPQRLRIMFNYETPSPSGPTPFSVLITSSLFHSSIHSSSSTLFDSQESRAICTTLFLPPDPSIPKTSFPCLWMPGQLLLSSKAPY